MTERRPYRLVLAEDVHAVLKDLFIPYSDADRIMKRARRGAGGWSLRATGEDLDELVLQAEIELEHFSDSPGIARALRQLIYLVNAQLNALD